jgi:UDP:flavonoid glycosyltransferase YjiC (YdhE family)
VRRRHFLFVTWWGGGNLTPVRVLGRRLVEAGHEVRVLSSSRLRSELEALDLAFVEHPGFVATPDDVAAEIARLPTDAVVVDFMQPDVFAAAEASGVPWAALVHTLGQPVLDDEHSTMLAFAPLAAVNASRDRFGLAAVERPIELLTEADRILVAGPAAIDRARRRTLLDGTTVRHLGALVEPPGADATWTPPVLGRSLVVVSLGTTPMDEAPVLQRVLDAASAHPDLALFATVGDHLEPTAFSAPPNATVSRLVQHSAVLPYAAAVVTHAGLGTVTAALAHGVPLVCVPLGRDQYDNATRVEELGAGVTLPATATSDELGAAIHRVLREDGPYRVAAGDLAGRIADESAPGRPVAELLDLAGGSA